MPSDDLIGLATVSRLFRSSSVFYRSNLQDAVNLPCDIENLVRNYHGPLQMILRDLGPSSDPASVREINGSWWSGESYLLDNSHRSHPFVAMDDRWTQAGGLLGR
jgi:hypothetical protein